MTNCALKLNNFTLFPDIVFNDALGLRPRQFSFSEFKIYQLFAVLIILCNDAISSMALLSIEKDLKREMTFEDTLCDFANAKTRKAYIL